ncbi:STM4504/CBY_0614 family protein [Paenibacillus odorifer]|uniref:Abortive infection protein-like C-terminal domain-containing protein n=1 Tax=Paenibacillus odorifer TaxID=189426 RepID=A0AAD0KLM2_9BACL|nr:hypothetical protein [Paenibacillus odorifer]AWV35167.1 hypothetical protein CD191_22420 [Paenibacillus odorifer]
MYSYEIYTKRQKRLLDQPVDPLQYTEMPKTFRIQVLHIWTSAIGAFNTYVDSPQYLLWEQVQNILSRELGLFHLGDNRDNGPQSNCKEFLLRESPENVLNIIDVSFNLLNIKYRKLNSTDLDDYIIIQSPDSAISELNKRFREHNLGYQFENGHIIRVDSLMIHENITKPSLTLLHNNEFKGAEEEFLKAYEHFRHGRNKESIAEALKAFESTIKTICDRRRWVYNPNKDTSSTLIDIIFKEGLVPSYLQSHFTSLKSTLTAGVPTLRNKTSGHGQGENTIELPEHFTAYALHLTATNILFLVECYLESEE